MRVGVVSIAFSGTHFMRRLLASEPTQFVDHEEGSGDLFAHVTCDRIAEIRSWRLPLIGVCRHPLAHAESWFGRGEHLYELLDSWRRFIDLAPTFAALVAVDSARRDEMLRGAAAVSGRPLTTDWIPVGSRGLRRPMTPHEGALLNDLIAEHAPFFSEVWP